VFTVVIFVSYFCAVRHGAAVTEWKMTWKKVRFWIQKMKKKEGIRSAEVASYDLLGFLCLLIVCLVLLLVVTTRMWANAQYDGRPAEYWWHPLFNAAKFG